MATYEATVYPAHEGCQNVVYNLTNGVDEYVLRISFRTDRDYYQLQAEVHFVDYLHKNGASVAHPVQSKQNCFVESITIDDQTVYVVVFTKSIGIRLVENHYQYREGVSIEEYYLNYGRALGVIHRLTKRYSPIGDQYTRPIMLDNIYNQIMPKYLPHDQAVLRQKFNTLHDTMMTLPRDTDSYGLIHADFGDGNFTIDYSNGNITTFDFDDASYAWFMYEIADAWVKGVGWAMFEDTAKKRKEKMSIWYNKVLEGYFAENTIDSTWLDKLPFFIKVLEMQWVLGRFQEAAHRGETMETNEEMLYKIKCIQHDIPYYGLYDTIYNHNNPFCLSL